MKIEEAKESLYNQRQINEHDSPVGKMKNKITELILYPLMKDITIQRFRGL